MALPTRLCIAPEADLLMGVGGVFTQVIGDKASTENQVKPDQLNLG